MNIKTWYQKRGLRFILERARRLNERYGFSARKAIDRIESCVEALRIHGCFPTFAVPGIVVERNLAFIKRLQELGAEIAIHGYNHVDLKTYPPAEASRQLTRAAELFRMNDLEVHGFRCPYLSATDDLLKAIPQGTFEYSSNKAIQWPIDRSTPQSDNLLFETIKGFYAPVRAESTTCLPWIQNGMVEIPVSVPDDLQLHDGLRYGLEQISQVWVDILHQTYDRGEVFNLMFHPELATFCEAPFQKVLQEAQSLQPGVWLARLRDVSAWWLEKSSFWVEKEDAGDHFILKFHCTPRATILCRGFVPQFKANQWDAQYRRLEAGTKRINCPVLPFIGLPPHPPQWIMTSLQEKGYILETGETAKRCSLFIDEARLGNFNNPVDLVAYIENTSEAMVRFWPWPNGCRSALCITGDLDALSLLDYAIRLLKK